MSKRRPISMTCAKLSEENPNIGADLDSVIIGNEPESCFNYHRQRRRGEGPVKNPRKWVRYDGVRVQVGFHRLIFIRAHGRIDAGLYVGHQIGRAHV